MPGVTSGTIPLWARCGYGGAAVPVDGGRSLRVVRVRRTAVVAVMYRCPAV
ncbi:hypothetical protein [Streptomyces sp. SID12501]|uniref:Uncharacterized protein n=1 Tax=Streptomyces sp. SID12501 TaxID=2706042 RepID=A0A6B3BQE6_9ACTN|nr:hypothetical protein [Streptomyces sp. SID12501]NEC86560.1 hypothetical protein [Streptomyces sp. SID12501]